MWLLDWPLIGVYSHWCIRNSKKGMGVATGVVVGIHSGSAGWHNSDFE